ncbi:hypothetical protein E4U43_002633 [Claviceps pusilla]|uniref:Copper-fist domain-containing protein n=1 Tax=Claviceps pusilla TaxID=123648 RepID=A0A9P7NHR2_9HYPO|nr:hypothetical protein E4U43_002633 [Claviceps pusilla]
MPLINGQKMACEPCIRGHRSTKCTHANERLMVPVRKPGRPLSSCPHPSSRPCACAAVTAAIPRKQKCRCGTSDTPAVEKQPDHDSSSSPKGATPSSPPKVGHVGFRVNKQSGKTGASRKQSVDLTGLHRMDSSQINIVPPYSVRTPPPSSASRSSLPVSDMSLYGSIAIAPGDRSYNAESSIYSMFPPYGHEPVTASTGQTKPTMTMNGRLSISTDGAAKPEPAAPRSCCGGGVIDGTRTPPVPVDPSDGGGSSSSNNNNSNNSHSSRSSTTTITTNNTNIEPAAARGCCSSRVSASTNQEKKHTLEAMPPPLGMSFDPNGAMMQPFQHSMAMSNGMYPYYAQPNIFNYPPQYGSFMQPLQPEQWRHFMAAAMAFGQNEGGGGEGGEGRQPFGIQTEPFPAQQQTPTTPNGTSWTSHHCSCGDACQCIGCAAHPYNEATQDYVRSAWNSMKEEPQNGRAHTNGNPPYHDGAVRGTNASNGDGDETTAQPSSNGTTTPNQPPHDGPWSPSAAQSPSEAASGASEEQALSASDFFFVSYPFADSCCGETMSCPCGDDCQCIGCAIHNNSDPMSGTGDANKL